MIKSDYLTTMSKFIKLNDVGLIGSYMETINFESKERIRTRADKLADIFISLKHNHLLSINLADNIKHIFISSCCLFVNKNLILSLGGLNDKYFPSSDFALSAKINYKHKTLFLPKRLSYRAVGNNESLKQSVCNDSIRCAYWLTFNICKTLKYKENKCKRKSSIAAVISEIGVRGYNNTDYSKIKRELNIKKIYSNKLCILMINIYSKLS